MHSHVVIVMCHSHSHVVNRTRKRTIMQSVLKMINTIHGIEFFEAIRSTIDSDDLMAQSEGDKRIADLFPKGVITAICL